MLNDQRVKPISITIIPQFVSPPTSANLRVLAVRGGARPQRSCWPGVKNGGPEYDNVKIMLHTYTNRYN